MDPSIYGFPALCELADMCPSDVLEAVTRYLGNDLVLQRDLVFTRSYSTRGRNEGRDAANGIQAATDTIEDEGRRDGSIRADPFPSDQRRFRVHGPLQKCQLASNVAFFRSPRRTISVS